MNIVRLSKLNSDNKNFRKTRRERGGKAKAYLRKSSRTKR